MSTFYFFIKDILKWNWHLFNEHAGVWPRGIWWILAQLGAITWVGAKSPAVSPTMAFSPSIQMSTWWKGRICFSIIIKIVLNLWTPWMNPRGPQGSMDDTWRTSGQHEWRHCRAAWGVSRACFIAHLVIFTSWIRYA